MQQDKVALQDILTPTIEAMGYEFWGLTHVPQGRHSILRIYIEKVDGITVTDCEQVSRQLSAVLDVEDPLLGSYILEVSSPGLDRPLFTKDQFKAYIGSGVNVRVHVPVEDRRHFKGVLQAVDDDEVVIKVEDKEYKLKVDNISKANLLIAENILKKTEKRKKSPK